MSDTTKRGKAKWLLLVGITAAAAAAVAYKRRANLEDPWANVQPYVLKRTLDPQPEPPRPPESAAEDDSPVS